MKRIEPKPLIGFLLNPFGTHARSIDYQNGVVCINARRKQNIQVADLSAPPLVTRGFVGSTLKITVDKGTQVLLRGANNNVGLAANMRFGTLQLRDEHARQSAT